VTHIRSSSRRTGRLLAVAVVSLGLVAGACSKKDDEGSTDSTATEETDATEDSAAPVETTGDSTDTTVVADTTVETDPPVAAKDPVPGGTLIVSGEAEVANAWTPAAMQCDSYCQQRARSFYDPLIAINADLEPVGVLVESFEANADSTEFTFTLRPDIKFHDGTALDAAAVVKNLQLSGTGLLIANAVRDFGKNADGSLAIEATGDLTFTIKTGKDGDLSQPRPWPNLPSVLAGQLGLIASPTWLDAVAAGTGDPTMAIGTGPFIVKSYAPRDKLVVERNPDYWQTDAAGNQLPFLDSIEYRVIEDSETAGQALQNGDIDIFSTSSAIVIQEFRDLPDEFPMVEQNSLTETNYLLIDLAKPGPTSDVRVRCALSKAINREELIELTAGGILQVANGLFSPGQEGYLEDNGFDTSQDIDGAKALIAEYQAENPGDVVVQYGTTVSAINAQTAELLKGYWEEIGVTTEIQQVPQDQFITNALFGVDTFFIYGWRNHAGTVIDNQYFWWHSSAGPPDGELALNFGRVNDPIVDENLEAQRGESDPAKRAAFAEEVNKQMAKECYQIPASWTLWGTPHKPEVQGLAEYVFPDGSKARDGAGFSGSFWTQALWLDPDA
jgi:peptide/nickel transport system substrate-binding protein